jgi:endonuclease YncB( thermonuclease family)
MKLTRHLLSFSLLILFSLQLQAATTISGRVVSITDGDTIKVLTPEKKQIKVRLASIDAPEKGQSYGNKAKQVLSDKIFGKQVSVEKVTTDRYKRLVGKVYLGDRDINAEMVEDGFAWVYRKYSNDPHLIELEKQAQDRGRGL